VNVLFGFVLPIAALSMAITDLSGTVDAQSTNVDALPKPLTDSLWSVAVERDKARGLLAKVAADLAGG
jgi:hypothetical protein